MTDSKTSSATAAPTPSLKPRVYRQCRIWHGYLSAFAFIALLFFAVTGIALNHPDWFGTKGARDTATNISLTPSQVQSLRIANSPGELLTSMVAAQTTLYGDFKDGALAMDQVFARLRGAKGSSDLRANLADGSVSVTIERATVVGVLNALHRGDTAGRSWQLFIDIMGGVLIVMALAGFAIFLSMSARLKTALLITGSSVLATLALFVLMVK